VAGLLTSDNLPLSEPTSAQTDSPTRWLAEIDQLDPSIREFVDAATAPNTRRAYENDLEHFRAWGGRIPASPQQMAKYLADHARALSTATLARRLAAIGHAHVNAGFPNPTRHDLVRITFRGIRRTCGRPQQRVAALTTEHLTAIVSSLGTSIKDVRDRALLLLGFAGGFRRSELVALDCESIEHCPSGLIVTIRWSKTDQERRGRKIAIPYSHREVCPVIALVAWTDLAKITEGPIFRPVTRKGDVLDSRLSAEAVAAIVKDRAHGIEGARYSGHSLRAGFVTSAALAGVPTWKIKAQTGHVSSASLERYIRCSGSLAEGGLDALAGAPPYSGYRIFEGQTK
jgi:site-specific recombinase XerD